MSDLLYNHLNKKDVRKNGNINFTYDRPKFIFKEWILKSQISSSVSADKRRSIHSAFWQRHLP